MKPLVGFAWGILVGLALGVLLALGWLWRHLRTQRRWMAKLGSLTGWQTPPITTTQALTHLVELLQHQQAESQYLAQQVQDWEYLCRHLPLGFIHVDQNNVVIHCNLTAQSLLKIENWRPNIKVLLEWVRSYELDQLVEQTRHQAAKAQRGSQRQMREWLFYPSGGEGKPVPIRGWAVALSQGQVSLFLEDRLEAKTLTQQRDRWASDVAHELKTPLTSIRLVAETLQTRVDPSIRHWVDRLLNEIIRLSSLVQDLLELSSLNLAAAAALQMRPLNLVPLVEEAWESLIPQSRQQTLDLQAPADVHLWGDERRLYRLFLNLLDNSLKSGKPGTPTHIGIQVAQGSIHIEVYDHGPGLPAAALGSIFEPFFRTDTARARSEGGTGLGLAIVKQIIEAHGSTVTASNHPETGGLWIQFSLRIKPHEG